MLSIAEKADLIRRMHDGESQKQLALEYGIGTSTVSDLKKHELEILRHVETNGEFVAKNRRKLESGAKADVEEAILEWLFKVKVGPRAIIDEDYISFFFCFCGEPCIDSISNRVCFHKVLFLLHVYFQCSEIYSEAVINYKMTLNHSLQHHRFFCAKREIRPLVTSFINVYQSFIFYS